MKAKNKFIALLFVESFILASVNGVLMQYIQSQENNPLISDEELQNIENLIIEKDTDDQEDYYKKNTNLAFDLSVYQTKKIEDQKQDYHKDTISQDQNLNNVPIHSFQSIEALFKPAPNKDSFGYNNCTQLMDAYSLINSIIHQKGILYWDCFNLINSSPIDCIYSDKILFNTEIKDYCKNPISNVNVTFYIFNRTKSYPDSIANCKFLSEIYDKLWFYIYYYNTEELVNYLNTTCLGKWILSIRNRILDSFWIQKISTNKTSIDGLSIVNDLAYFLPGKYNMISVANLKPFPGFCICEHVFESIQFFRFRIFYDHINVNRESTTMKSITLDAQYSDTSNLSIMLLDDEGNSIPQQFDLNKSARKLEYHLYRNSNWEKIGEKLTNQNGIATENYVPWIEPGDYQLKVIFTGDSYYQDSTLICSLTIHKEITYLSLEQKYAINNTDILTIIAHLLDDENNTIPQPKDVIQEGRNIAFYIAVNGKWVLKGNSIVTLNGSAELTTSFLLPYGEYPLKIVFNGDNYYLSSEKLAVIEINREQTILKEMEDFTIQTTDTILLSVYLTDNELIPIYNKTIFFEIFREDHWQQVGYSVTKENGNVKYSWRVLVPPGTYMFRAIFYEDEYFTSSSNAAIANIEKEDTALRITDKVSNIEGKYDIHAQLVEDDPAKTPIPNQGITLWVDGNQFSGTTDNNGFVTITIDKDDFNDISIEAAYQGSTFFKPASDAKVKTFTEELNIFTGYSKNDLIDLFNKHSNLPANTINMVAGDFFNYKEDIKDGILSSTTSLQQFISKIGLPYEVYLNPSNAIELRDYSYFLDPITGGDCIIQLILGSMSANEYFAPEEGTPAYVGQAFTFSHLFEWIEWEDVYEWIFNYITLAQLLNYLHLDSIDALIQFLIDLCEAFWDFINAILNSLFGGSETFDFTFEGHPYSLKITWNLLYWVLDWAKRGVLTLVDQIPHYLSELIEQTLGISIPSSVLGEWLNRVGGLFWHYINGILYLGFKYIAQKIQDIVINWFTILSFIDIGAWKILENVNSKINKEKADEFINTIISEEDNAFNSFLTAIEENEIYNLVINPIQDFFRNDAWVEYFQYYTGISPYSIEFGADFQPSDLFNIIAPILSGTFGKSITGNNIETFINALINIIETNSENIELPDIGFQSTMNPDEIESSLLSIIAGWKNLEDFTVSDIDAMGSLCYNLQGMQDVLNIDYVSFLETFYASQGKTLINLLLPTIVYWVAQYDIWFPQRTFYEIAMEMSFLISLCIFWLDVADASNILRPIENTYADDFLVVSLATIMYLFADSAQKSNSADSDYKKFIAQYFIDNAIKIGVQPVTEILIEIFGNFDETAETLGDIIGTVFEFVLAISNIWNLCTYVNNTFGLADAIKWGLIDGFLSFPDAILPVAAKDESGIALTICILFETGAFEGLAAAITNPTPW